MHGLPTAFDPSFLLGKEIQVICFAAYQVSLTFTDGIWLQIEGGWELRSGNDVVERVSSFPVWRSALPQIIGEKVTDITFDRDSGDIALLLSHGSRLHIAGDNGPYESYRLCDGQHETIV